ncbi:hypothetical protein Q5P01_008805 [Channa striata]|uniref:Uncharacterized protein n=1 Tax=Channa striata TaxID=64152 RepID=A0AA88SRZ0_CHASR|nr:hypothetical protein Q5P01_008805 [Channa striata]
MIEKNLKPGMPAQNARFHFLAFSLPDLITLGPDSAPPPLLVPIIHAGPQTVRGPVGHEEDERGTDPGQETVPTRLPVTCSDLNTVRFLV